MSLLSYEIDDPTFIRDLYQSDTHVRIVRQWIEAMGYQVQKPEIRVRDQVENMSFFSDEGDLFILKNGLRFRIEVKQRFVNFSDIIPFSYSTIIVDVAHTWEKAIQKPHLYILTNPTITWCYVVQNKTSVHWRRTEKFDKAKKRMRTFLECPIGFCLLFPIVIPPTKTLKGL